MCEKLDKAMAKALQTLVYLFRQRMANGPIRIHLYDELYNLINALDAVSIGEFKEEFYDWWLAKGLKGVVSMVVERGNQYGPLQEVFKEQAEILHQLFKDT